MLTCLVFVLVVVGALFVNYRHYQKVVSAAGGYPYQVGLTKTVITPCVLTLGVCVATGVPEANAACNTKGVGVCTTYSYVSGQMAGGMGNGVLLNNTVISKIGLKPGASYIGGGISAVLMDDGVSASAGGAMYGLAVATERVVDFVIAGKKNNP